MKRFVFLILIILTTAACQTFSELPGINLVKITLNLTYIPNVQFAPFYVAIDKGFFADEGLEVTLNYGNEADLVALVGSGNQQFMIASGEQVLLSRSQGLPVVTVLDWYKDYPVGVVSLSESNIKSLEDLQGRSVGLPGLYGANYIGFKALAAQAGLGESDYSLVSIGFTQVESLVSRNVDAAVVYLANEPVQLRSMGYLVNVIRVADFLDLVGNGLVTNEETIADNPDLVRSVVNAMWRGIKYSEENPDQAFEICKEYVENLAGDTTGVQRQVLEESIKLWYSTPPKQETLSRWDNMQQLLLQIGLMNQPIDLKRAFSNAFIP